LICLFVRLREPWRSLLEERRAESPRRRRGTTAAEETPASGGGRRAAAAAAPAEAAAAAAAAGHFMLNPKGFIGFGSRVWSEGATGHFNPEGLKGGMGKTYGTAMPGVGKKDWVTGLCTIFSLLELLLNNVLVTRLGGRETPPTQLRGAPRDPDKAAAARKT
jgi:hypothetical protein